MIAKKITTLQNGKYTINSVLSESKFEITYLATQSYQGSPVVIKTIHPSLSHYDSFLQWQEKFYQLAQLFSQCQHPHLVKILDIFLEGDRAFLVINYVPGLSLAELLKPSPKQNGLSETEAVYYIRQIAIALNIIHTQGIIHGNINPKNLIIRQQTESIILVDFGMGRSLLNKTLQTQASLLSDEYSPIEIYLPEVDCTPATDIYSLGAILYFLLTGYPPLPAHLRLTESSYLANHLRFPELRQMHPNLSDSIEYAIVKGLEIRPSMRSQSLDEWMNILPNNKVPMFNQTSTITNHSNNNNSNNNTNNTKKNNNNPHINLPKINQVRVNNLTISQPKPVNSSLTTVNNKQEIDNHINSGKNGGRKTIITPAIPQKKPVTTVKQSTNVALKEKVEIEIENQNIPQPKSPVKKTQTIAKPVEVVAKKTQTPVKKKKKVSGKKKVYKKKRSPVKILLITTAIAALIGSAFGLTLRLISPKVPGASPWHSKQSFPPRNNWPFNTNSDPIITPNKPEKKSKKQPKSINKNSPNKIQSTGKNINKNNNSAGKVLKKPTKNQKINIKNIKAKKQPPKTNNKKPLPENKLKNPVKKIPNN